MQALCANLRDAFPHSRCAVILAIAADKDLAAVASQLASLRPALVVCTRVPIGGQNHRSTEPTAVRAAIEAAAGFEEPRWTTVVTADDMSDAVWQACVWADAESSQSTVICVTGSNYAVGAMYGLLQSAKGKIGV
jgi:folylpolyglutamate synthase/dihydropteroate synthase